MSAARSEPTLAVSHVALSGVPWRRPGVCRARWTTPVLSPAWTRWSP
jgi:hypothetical protein